MHGVADKLGYRVVHIYIDIRADKGETSSDGDIAALFAEQIFCGEFRFAVGSCRNSGGVFAERGRSSLINRAGAEEEEFCAGIPGAFGDVGASIQRMRDDIGVSGWQCGGVNNQLIIVEPLFIADITSK